MRKRPMKLKTLKKMLKSRIKKETSTKFTSGELPSRQIESLLEIIYNNFQLKNEPIIIDDKDDKDDGD